MQSSPLDEMRWEDCEALVKKSQAARDVFFEYKYGPRTTVRRNMALKERKALKASGELDKAFIKFPAILMGKKNNEHSYRVIRNFSKEPVVFEDRRNDQIEV